VSDLDKRLENGGVDAGDLADEAELSGIGGRAGGEKLPIHSGESDGNGAGLVD
jgi:hypothetical protein